MKASDYIIKFLVDHGTDMAFVFTGGAIAHIIDSIRKYEGKMTAITAFLTLNVVQKTALAK